MARFIAWRTLGILPILTVTLVITFFSIYALPGDPVLVMLGDRASDVETSTQLRRQYGLDQPLVMQFFDYATGVLTGNFGLSFRFIGTPVSELIGEALLISPLLAVAAMSVGLPVGAVAGTVAAIQRGRVADFLIMLLMVVGLSVPSFALATGLMYLLSVQLGLLPVAGWGTLSQMVLPVMVLAVPGAAYTARMTRTLMLEVMQNDFIRTARAKGLSRLVVIWRHGFPNTLVPQFTSAGVMLGALISNAFVVEIVFNIPGLGRLAIEAVFARDYPVTMAVVLLFMAFFLVISLCVDVAYALVDPRVRERVTNG